MNKHLEKSDEYGIIRWIEMKSLLLLDEPQIFNSDVEKNYKEFGINVSESTTVGQNYSTMTRRFNIFEIYNRVWARIAKHEDTVKLINDLKRNLRLAKDNNQSENMVYKAISFLSSHNDPKLTKELYALISTLSDYYVDMKSELSFSQIFEDTINKILNEYRNNNESCSYIKTQYNITLHCSQYDQDVDPWLKLLDKCRDEFVDEEIDKLFFDYRYNYNHRNYDDVYDNLIAINKLHGKEEKYRLNELRMLRLNLFGYYCDHVTNAVCKGVQRSSYTILLFNLCMISSFVLGEHIKKYFR